MIFNYGYYKLKIFLFRGSYSNRPYNRSNVPFYKEIFFLKLFKKLLLFKQPFV